MIKIRDDIFPTLMGLFNEPREKILEVWIEEAFNPFNNRFLSLEEFINFINQMKEPKNAEKFIRLSQFYNLCKNFVPHTFTKLIMIFSIIESIVSLGKKYKPFKDWIMGQDDLINLKLTYIKNGDLKTFKQCVEELKEEYHREFGSTRNVAEFFDKYISDNGKVKIIKSFKIKRNDIVYGYSAKLYEKIPNFLFERMEDLDDSRFKIEKSILTPICYDWKYCYIEYGHCCPDIYCLLIDNKELLSDTLRKIINVIYHMRSDFVHNAKMPPIGEAGIDFSTGIYNNEIVLIELNIGEFSEIFEDGFINYYKR